MTRQTKTPAQRAQEAYDLSCRIAERLEAKTAAARAEYIRLEEEHAAAVTRRDYLAGHPDLPKQSKPANQSGDNPS